MGATMAQKGSPKRMDLFGSGKRKKKGQRSAAPRLIDSLVIGPAEQSRVHSASLLVGQSPEARGGTLKQ